MSQQLKVAKDSLVSSLYELSKAANEASSAVVDFYNSIHTDDDQAQVFIKLAESLRLLTNKSTNVSNEANNVIGSIVTADGIKQPVKRKVERDPNAPKKPLTVFFAYSAYLRQTLKEEREEKGLSPLSSTEITQEISKKWNELSEEEKDLWKAAYVEELEKYHNVKEKYLEAKKNGEDVTVIGANPAPVPIPAYLTKRKLESSGSSEKKEKKKKSKKRKSTHEGDVSIA